MNTIKRYEVELLPVWNDFIKKARNGFFLFDRNYMDYHADRFADHSLLFYKEDELLAVLPASQQGDTLSSHAGLTYGGFIVSIRAGAEWLIEAFNELKKYLKENAIRYLVYKAIPYIYHQLPSQEDLYILFRSGATLFRRDISSVIDLSQKVSFTKGTKSNLNKARKNNLSIEESKDFKTFMEIEEELLRSKYGTKPAHSIEEISLLAGRFPENIKMFLVYKEEGCLGGTIIFETGKVIHTQYIGITEEGKETGALDIVTDYLIQRYSNTHHYLSFGISTTHEGRELNTGLIKNKESFGARAIVNDFYKLEIS